MRVNSSVSLVLTLLMTSCAMLRENPKYDFGDGIYSSKVIDQKTRKVYVENEGDTIHVYPLVRESERYVIDTTEYKRVTFSNKMMDSHPDNPTFLENSLDLDFLTIPFKYRFPVKGFPGQFNTNINGAVYIGYRTDGYVLHYSKNPLGVSKRYKTHFGFSFGGFTGIGGTAMNPWVTRGNIMIEYDGVVWTKGIAGIIGLNNVTVGLATGWDHLLDDNKKHWIYQRKPWIGFAFGLNIN